MYNETDPKNTDYLAEHGAMRNFEPWRDSGEVPETEEERLVRLEAEMAEGDPMAALEGKTVDAKREMDILDKLQEIRMRNARLERADNDTVLDTITSRAAIEGVDEEYETRQAELQRRLEAEEDEAEVRKVFSRLIPPDAEVVPSIELDESLQDDSEIPQASTSTATSSSSMPPPPPPSAKVASIKRKLAEVEPDALSLLSEEAKQFAATVAAKSSALGTSSSAPMAKKKKKAADNALAAKLGIKVPAKDLKGKGKALV